MKKNEFKAKDLRAPDMYIEPAYPEIPDLLKFLEEQMAAETDTMKKDFFMVSLDKSTRQLKNDLQCYLQHIAELENIPERRHSMTWALIVSYYDRLQQHIADSPSAYTYMQKVLDDVLGMVTFKMEKTFGVRIESPLKHEFSDIFSLEFLSELVKEVFNVEFQQLLDPGAGEDSAAEGSSDN